MAEEKAQSDKSILIGKKLGDYQLMEMLAAGGMARIYKGLDGKLQRRAAVKVLMRELMESDDSLTERFQREARAVAQLEHDNIVTIYQYGEQDGLYFLAMRYIDGRDLADEIADLRRDGKEMDVMRALNILGQIAAALDHAHEAGIIHRDIKPSNILIDKHDKAYLTDFGLVLWSADRTMGTAFGTPRYISPEQAIASEKSVPQSDIYSLAVVLYEILTGSMLFRADTPLQIAISHISEPPPPPRSINPNIPEAVERELLKALSKDPSDRHRKASDFINAVRRAYEQNTSPSTGTVPPSTEIGKKTPIIKETKEFEAISAEAAKAKPPVSAPKIESPAPKVENDAKTPEGKSWIQRNRPMMIGLGAVAIIGLIALFALLSQPRTPAVTDIATPTENTDVVQATLEVIPPTEAGTSPTTAPVAAGGIPVLLQYDDENFVFRPENRATSLNVNGLIVATSGQTTGLTGAEITAQRIPDGKCVVVIRGSRAFAPSEWGCGAVGVHFQKTVNPQQAFWREAGSVTEFEIRLDDSVIATCPVARRGAGRQECRVNFPAE